MLHVEWYHVCWPRLTAKRVEPVVSISWASCFFHSRSQLHTICQIKQIACIKNLVSDLNKDKKINVKRKTQEKVLFRGGRILVTGSQRENVSECSSVRPSVRPSARPSVSLSLSLFPMPALYQNEWITKFHGKPVNGSVKCTGSGEILQIIAIYLENGKDRATLIWSHIGRSIRVGSIDLEWPWKARREGQNFLADLHNYAWDGWTVSQWGST